MVPSAETSSFKMVEPEFALEVLEGSLGPVPLLDYSDELLPRGLPRKAGQVKVQGLGFAVAPFHQQPLFPSLLGLPPIVLVLRAHHSPCRKSRAQLLARPL